MIFVSFMFKTGLSSSIYLEKIHFFRVFIGFIRKKHHVYDGTVRC